MNLPSNFSHLAPRLVELLDQLPHQPGVYLLKSQRGKIIYIGKAKNLFNRVRSYFNRSGDNRAFVPLLGQLVEDIETIVTEHEKEALLLENNLIKQHKPRFNVMLRDDKNYLVLRLDPRADYPRLEITRGIKKDNARYFGPYHSASDCRQTVRVVNRFFQLRTCSDRTLTSRGRPCLQYQIKRCPAPCVFAVDPDEYAQHVEDVTLFLRGKGELLLADLRQRMQGAAAGLEFEHAARLRDQIAAVENSLLRQRAVSDTLMDQDVVGFFREGDRVDLVVLMIRQGKLSGQQAFSLSGQEFPDEEVVSAFVGRFYDRGEQPPRELLLPQKLDDQEVKTQWLSELRGGPVSLLSPRRGTKRTLLELARRNAESNFQTRRSHGMDAEQAMSKLQSRLRLSQFPQRIECFDISGFQEQMVVASMAVLESGEPRPGQYRRFKVKSAHRDDFAAMYEVLSRRLRRARQGDPGWALPNLIVVDGGKAQLSMALAALRDVGTPPEVAPPDIVALAKERASKDSSTAHDSDPAPSRASVSSSAPSGVSVSDGDSEGKERQPDRVFLPGVKDPIRLRPNTAELYLLSRIRDEAHRFAITYHRQLRQRKTMRSGLEDIPGIGPRRRRELLTELGSLKRVREATVEQLAAVPTMTLRAAEAVAAYFAAKPMTESAPEHRSNSTSGREFPRTSKKGGLKNRNRSRLLQD